MNFFLSKNKILIIAFLFFLVPFLVLAEEGTGWGGLVPCGGPNQPPCQLCHLFEMIGLIINFITWRIVPAIATLMIVVSGIMFFTALGDPGKLKSALNIIKGTIVGFLIIILAWSITVALYGVMGATEPEGWWEISNVEGCP